MNQTVDQTHAGTNESDEDKAKNQLIRSDRTDEFANPSDRISDPRANIGHHRGNAVSNFRRLKTSFQRPRCISRSNSAMVTKAKKKPTK